MSLTQSLEHFFKPEVRNGAAEFIRKNAVVISVGSDTLIEGYVKGSTAIKVSLKAETIEADTFYADCSCPSSKKGQLCKHIWAMLLWTETKYPDFLSSKQNIEKKSTADNPKASAFKAKQDDYKKQQYQKQKLRNKSIKDQKKKSKLQPARPEYPEDVEKALQFFEQNGFPLQIPFDEETLKNAKKKLSRVFHPDIGGSHQESVDLNVNYDVLIRFQQD